MTDTCLSLGKYDVHGATQASSHGFLCQRELSILRVCEFWIILTRQSWAGDLHNAGQVADGHATTNPVPAIQGKGLQVAGGSG